MTEKTKNSLTGSNMPSGLYQGKRGAKARRNADELVFDHEGLVDVEATILNRDPDLAEPYPAPDGKWKAFAATAIMPSWTANMKSAMGWLIHHANPTTGACYPSHSTLAKEMDCNPRSVRRALAALEKTGCLSWRRRGYSSNAYFIEWEELYDWFDVLTFSPSGQQRPHT